MIENQLSAVPSGKTGNNARKDRQQKAIGQDLLREIDPQAGIGASHGQQHHGGNGMVPARNAHANAGNRQQFGRTGKSGENTESKGGTSRPGADLHPELISGPPKENVRPQRRDHEGDGKMNEHGMDRVAGHGNGGGNVLFSDIANGRIGMIGTRFNAIFRAALVGSRTFLFGNFLVFFFARLFRHAVSPAIRALGLATPVFLAGCTGELSTLDPVGPRAQSIAALWWIMLAGSIVLFALVLGLLALTYLRPNLLKGLTPGQWIIGGGLVLPVPVLLLLTGTALVLGEQLLPKGENMTQIEAQAERWAWRFSYPGRGGGPQEEVLHMPVGEPVDILVTSRDVIHSFWVPRLGGKMDAIPGHTNTIRLEASEPGTYWGICSEFCGEGHQTMMFRVEAHEPADFDALFRAEAP